jgi:hypothetical protein
MTKPEQKIQLRKEIKQLEEKAAERLEYLIKNPDAENYEEIARDKRAIEVKIVTKRRWLTDIDSIKVESIAPCSVFIPFNLRYAKR